MDRPSEERLCHLRLTGDRRRLETLIGVLLVEAEGGDLVEVGDLAQVAEDLAIVEAEVGRENYVKIGVFQPEFAP